MSPDAVHVAIGGNLGEVASNLAQAVRLLDCLPSTRVAKVSGLYRTAPVGGPVNPDGSSDQPDFLNGAVELHTGLDPLTLMRALLATELDLGRVRQLVDGPRTVDLDLILWGDKVVATEELILPHPRMHLRGFVLAPLAEIAPGAVHPLLGKTVLQLLEALGPLQGVSREESGFTPLERLT